MKTTTQFQLVPITKLVPYINNARTHSPEQIAKLRSSLREFGFINPVIIDQDFGIIAGHGRLIAAKEEGFTEIPCVFAEHLTEAQKKAYIIADNRMAMDAGWDEELLRVEIEALQAADFDPLLTGFDEKELADLFADDSGSEAKDDDYGKLKNPDSGVGILIDPMLGEANSDELRASYEANNSDEDDYSLTETTINGYKAMIMTYSDWLGSTMRVDIDFGGKHGSWYGISFTVSGDSLKDCDGDIVWAIIESMEVVG